MKQYYKCNICHTTCDLDEGSDFFPCPNCKYGGTLELFYLFKCKMEDCKFTEYVTALDFNCPECEADIGEFSKISSSEEDKGSHYRNTYLDKPFDVYRAIKIFGITNPIAQHMFKKLSRGTKKGHTEEDLIKELQCCLDRWKEIVEEDKDA